MKSWVYVMMVVAAAGSLVGCGSKGSGSSTGGTGGSGGATGGGGSGGTTVTTSSSSMTTTTTTTTTTSTMVDCTMEADFQSCATCFADQYPVGAPIYNGLVQCVICSACYTVCDGAGSGCPMAPPMTDACDTGTPGKAACGDGMTGCIACSFAGSCKTDLDACNGEPECVDFSNALQGCPP